LSEGAARLSLPLSEGDYDRGLGRYPVYCQYPGIRY